MMVKHKKTYTLEVVIDKFSSRYDLFREACDKADTDPFLHTNEIFKIIETEIKPLVPFKRICGGGYRLVDTCTGVIKMLVTFDLSSTEIDFI